MSDVPGVSVSTAAQSLQERYFPQLPCFGCGPANAKGLQLRSYAADGDQVTATFHPWPEHDNGLGYLNGGIIATVLDCHGAAAVTHEAFQRGWPPVESAALPYVTAGLEVSYQRPAPLKEPVTLFAEITSASEAQMTVHVWLTWEEKTRAEATARWKRWRPR